MTPLFLSSRLELEIGNTGVPDLAQLQAPAREPMFIDAVHFTIASDAGTKFDGTPPPANLGGLVRVRFKVEGHHVSEDFIPVWNYCPVHQDVSEVVQSAEAPDNENFDITAYNYFVWRLPRPLFVPANGLFEPIFSYVDETDGDQASYVTVDIGYTARRLGSARRAPKEMAVPFAAIWLAPDTIGATPTVTEAASSARDLFNPYSKAMRLQRFIGRIQVWNADEELGVFPRDAMNDLTPFGEDAGTRALAALYRSTILVKLADSRGRNITGDFYPFGQVFDDNTRAWTFDLPFPGKEWIQARLQGLSAGGVAEDYHVKPMISLLGHRMEAL